MFALAGILGVVVTASVRLSRSYRDLSSSLFTPAPAAG
jgi:hypothetical protein